MKNQKKQKKNTHSEARAESILTLTVMCAGANVQKGKSLDSPLHAAAEKDCTEVVKLLLDFGADINARNTELQRPVDVAPPSSLSEGFLLLYEGIIHLSMCICSYLSPTPKSAYLDINTGSPGSHTLIFIATPRLLSQLCRQCIRNCVGRDRLHLLAHLPLPNRLRSYLQYH